MRVSEETLRAWENLSAPDLRLLLEGKLFEPKLEDVAMTIGRVHNGMLLIAEELKKKGFDSLYEDARSTAGEFSRNSMEGLKQGSGPAYDPKTVAVPAETFQRIAASGLARGSAFESVLHTLDGIRNRGNLYSSLLGQLLEADAHVQRCNPQDMETRQLLHAVMSEALDEAKEMKALLNPDMEARAKTILSAAGLEERARLEAAIGRNIGTIAAILRETGVDGKTLLGLGPEELKSHGAEVVEFLDRLKALLSMSPMLMVTGDEAGRYTTRPSVLLASESIEGAVIALKALRSSKGDGPIERMEYMATPEEVERLGASLREKEVPIALVGHRLDSLAPILNRLLRALAGAAPELSQSGVNEFYGINLNRLAEQLKQLAQMGV